MSLTLSFTFRPYPLHLLSFLVNVSTLAMHSAFLPLTFIDASIRPGELAVAVPVIGLVATFIYSPIRPFITTLAMHHVVQPRSDVASTVRPFVVALATHLVTDPFSSVSGAIRPYVSPGSILLSLGEDALEVGTI